MLTSAETMLFGFFNVVEFLRKLEKSFRGGSISNINLAKQEVIFLQKHLDNTNNLTLNLSWKYVCNRFAIYIYDDVLMNWNTDQQ